MIGNSLFRWLALLALILAGSYFVIKKPDLLKSKLEEGMAAIAPSEAKPTEATVVKPPAVSAVRVAEAEFTEAVLVTGSLIAREEILVAPEVEGFKVLKINVDQGDRVKKGDVLATLVADTLDAQLAQNTASAARATASVAQARSTIVEAEARQKQAKADLERARPLVKSGYLSGAVFDQREAAAKTSTAQVEAARDALKAAEAAKSEVDAQRKEISWRRQNTDVRAPASGIISRRGARLGGIATAAGAGEPLFRIIQNGEIELDAEVSELNMAKLKTGQAALITVTGSGQVEGKLRLISPEIDPLTRLGRVKIFFGDNPALRIGAFGSGTIVTSKAKGVSLPVTAVSTAADKNTVLVITDGKVSEREIVTGLTSSGRIEVKSGLSVGDVVVARAGSFLRNGDTVRPIFEDNSTPSATNPTGAAVGSGATAGTSGQAGKIE
jgi:HlyD family secretion protein